MKPKRKYKPGSEKRKLKKSQEEQNKKMKNMMLQYTKKCSTEQKTDNGSDNPPEEINSLKDIIDFQDEAMKVMEKNTDNCSIDGETDQAKQPEVLKVNSAKKIDNFQENPAKFVENVNVTTTDGGEAFGFNSDPASWNIVSSTMIEYFINNPPRQNMELLNETEKIISGCKRLLTENNFYRLKKNNEKVLREWLVLSPTNKSLFCWICKLFSNSKNSSKLSTSGFNDWKHVSVRLAEHENSFSHRETVLKMSSRLQTSQRIDSGIILHYQHEVNYWRSVLKRIVATVKFLSLRGMAFFGDDETVGSIHNGNFIGCLELIAQFDPFLASHLSKFGNPGTGNTSYLSSTSVNEFIELMADKVLKEIIQEILAAKYFSLILDSTLDVTHLDQLCFVLRYINPDCDPVERFLKFIPIYGHGAEYLTNTVICCLKELNLDMQNCRGQAYDNAKNMAGKYSGLQARIKNLNPLADFVPCAAHSLNLVGVHAAESCTTVVKFFCLLQELYNFFSSSSYRWQMLHEKLINVKQLTLKNRSQTRWCADANATNALRKNYRKIVDNLRQIADSNDQTASTKSEANSILKKLLNFETVLNTVIWDTILQRINKTSKIFQNPTGSLKQLSPLFDSLMDFIKFVRDNFDIYEREAIEISPESVSYENIRKKITPRSRCLDDTNSTEVHFEPRDKFIKTCHYVLCDSLISHLSSRKEPYDKLVKKFSAVINLHSNVFQQEDAKSLQQSYPLDLEEDFSDELNQFSSFIKEDETLFQMLKTLQDPHLSSAFPNVETALRIFLTIPISNCTGERSFSKLKKIKSPYRSCIHQKKLSSLAILSLNGDVTNKLDYDDIINSFAECKIRKKPLKN